MGGSLTPFGLTLKYLFVLSVAGKSKEYALFEIFQGKKKSFRIPKLQIEADGSSLGTDN